MNRLPIIIPGRTYPKWGRPEHFLNLIAWNGLDRRVDIATEFSTVAKGPPLYVLNLNNQYRLDHQLAATKRNDSVCVYDVFNREIWAEVERRDGFLVLDAAVEALDCRDDVAEGLMRGIETQGINPERVVVLNNNLRARALFETRFLGNLKSSPKIVDFNSCFWLISGLNRMVEANHVQLAARAARVLDEIEKPRAKKFVSFNGRLRAHRFYVVLWLLANDFIDQGSVSFLGYLGGAADLKGLKRRMASDHFPDPSIVDSHFEKLVERMPMSIDVSLEESQASSAYKTTLPWRSQPESVYDGAYFSLIVDTEFRSEEFLFLTPIAFKSFMNFSPFIYFGNFGALKEMRRLGFKTFSPFIDETYDSVENATERMRLALAETRRLCNMSVAELSAFYRELWLVLEHNYWNIHRDAPARFSQAFQADILDRMDIEMN